MHINLFISDMYNNFFILKTLQTFLISVLFSFVYAIFYINFGMKLHRYMYQLFYCALDYRKCFALEFIIILKVTWVQCSSYYFVYITIQTLQLKQSIFFALINYEIIETKLS